MKMAREETKEKEQSCRINKIRYQMPSGHCKYRKLFWGGVVIENDEMAMYGIIHKVILK